MMFDDAFFTAWQPRLLSLLRIVVALLFLEHGLSKLIGFPIAAPAEMPPLILAAGIIETFGSLLLLVGLYTRVVAFVMSGQMAVAYFMAHLPQGFYPIANRGDAAILFCFVFLYLAIAGGGVWGIDRLRRPASLNPA